MKEMIDVIIVGSGIAGLYTALSFEQGMRILILTKSKIADSNSYLAQGGIAAAVDKENDTIKEYFEDTMRAGAGICDEKALEVMLNESTEVIAELIKLGADFDKKDGKISLTKEAGHRKSRILHIDGDATGRGIMEVLIKRVKERDNITIKENCFCWELIKEGQSCIGVKTLEIDDVCTYYAPAVVLAAGGVGIIYGVTTNAFTISGDSIAMAYRAGAEIADMEFVQFHPTVYHQPQMNRFLISEAVRGEGAFLRNLSGKRFMHDYDVHGELAPRDVVARAIVSEMKKTSADHVFLDLTHMDPEYTKKRFPNIYAKCMEDDIDFTKKWIPVSPAQHYLMGGIKTDINGKTSIAGLYACGENARTGVHGANRLASNSLLEGLVFARRTSKFITREITGSKSFKEKDWKCQKIVRARMDDVVTLIEKIQKIMQEYAGIVRTRQGLKTGLDKLAEIEKELNLVSGINQQVAQCHNMLTVAMIVFRQALSRGKSLGAHYLVPDKEKV